MSLDKIFKKIFKAYDIRGVVPDELNSEIAYKIGQALAAFLPEGQPLAVGRDMRLASKELTGEFIKGILSQGRDVWDIGLVTSDMVYFAIGKYGLAGGAVITASHNPKQYSGIKLYQAGVIPIGGDNGLADIQKLALDHLEPKPNPGQVIKKDVNTEWINHALSFIDINSIKQLKVGMDAGNGMAGATLPQLNGKTPLIITPLYFELDGDFPNHPADPINPTNLRDLCQLVRGEGLDAGIAFDGDGDRAVFVDETGTPVPPGVAQAILSEYFLQKYPKAAIVVDLSSSRGVAETVQKHGGRLVRSRVGHSFVNLKMYEEDAVFGSESSGHFYFKDNFYTDSGLIAALIMMEVLSRSGLKFSELAKQYNGYYQSGIINYQAADLEKIISRLKEQFKDADQDLSDGLSVSYVDWWFSLRASNTEPVVRLMVEASSQQLLNEKLALVESFIKE